MAWDGLSGAHEDEDERYPRHAPRRRICYALPCNATISKTKDKEVKFIKDTLMQKAYELSLWKIKEMEMTRNQQQAQDITAK